MSNNKEKSGFNDPLDAIINRIKEDDGKSGRLDVPKINDTSNDVVMNKGPEVKAAEREIPTPPIDLTESFVTDDFSENKKETPETPSSNEVNYGENDLDDELREIEAAEKAERAQLIKEAEEVREANKPKQLPPEMYDMSEITADVAHQANNQLIVADMVHEVVKRHNIPSGGVPEVDPQGIDKDLKFHVMGELVACYQNDGPVITEKFEALVLNNWYLDSGITARQYVDRGYKDIVDGEKENNQSTTNKPEAEEDDQNTKEKKADNPTININVPTNTPVTVNVDKDIVANMDTDKKVINVNVIEVTETEMRSSTVITNSDIEGIISAYDPGIQDIPVTLPVSGYKVIMRPIGYFESVALIAPTARNAADVLLKQWNIIYDHIKWTSIGMFNSFEEFLEKTKYVDFQFFLWALLVASAKGDEMVTITCGDKACNHKMNMKYDPREMIHINEKLIPAYYDEVDKAAAGDEAAAVYNKIWGTRRIYELPTTKSIIEFGSPSVKEFLEEKLGRMREIFTRFYPDQNFDEAFPTIISKLQKGELQGGQFAVLFGASVLISAASVVYNGKEYRYTKWDKIETILMKHLDFSDSYILFNDLFEKNADILTTPVSFSLKGFTCPNCGRTNEDVPVDDIGQSLLFLLSLGYENTKINLIEQQKNS